MTTYHVKFAYDDTTEASLELSKCATHCGRRTHFKTGRTTKLKRK
jgi:hypothetical protein